jgi:DNA-directed RNA polymerase subunit H (RpoH/RPB5)
MSSNSNQILNIYKSRKNILDIMESQGFDIDDYNGFSINEVDAMVSNNQLDMLIDNPSTKQKAYLKYYLSARQIRPGNLDEIIEDLYSIDNVLEKKDTLIIITEDEPNDSIINRIKYLYDHEGIFVVIHNIHRLQYNLLEHTLVPKCDILKDNEIDTFKDKFNIKLLNQLPEISRFDPQALALCMRPGQIGKFTRNSITALETEYYRVCV